MLEKKIIHKNVIPAGAVSRGVKRGKSKSGGMKNHHELRIPLKFGNPLFDHQGGTRHPPELLALFFLQQFLCNLHKDKKR